jgi:hypothetical protein
MIGLIISIILFNIIAFKTNKNLITNQIIHIWLFTVVFQQTFDIFVDFKFDGYWYFTKDIDWEGLPAHLVLLQPVNMMFLNWYPFKSSITQKVRYVFFWVIGILLYEVITLLPEPWGYFSYGWWKFYYSVVSNPILFLILLVYYKWICKLEKKSFSRINI